MCLSIYILSGFQANVAAAFLLEARQSRKRSLEAEIQEAEATDNISLWFRETSFEKLCDLQDGKDSSIHAEASKFVSKWRTAEWVAQQNYECGLAPTYDRLARKYCAELEARNMGYLAQPLLASAEGSDGKNWLRWADSSGMVWPLLSAICICPETTRPGRRHAADRAGRESVLILIKCHESYKCFNEPKFEVWPQRVRYGDQNGA